MSVAGSWDFTLNSDIQLDLSGKISNYADAYDSKVNLMYNSIEKLGQHWVGEDYNAFVEGTNGYKNALSDLSASFRMYSEHFKKVAEGTDELSNELKDIIMNMTTYGSENSGVLNTVVSPSDASHEISDSSNEASESYTEESYSYNISRGDSCSVYGENVTFYGRDGTYNYYTKGDGFVYYDNGNELEKVINENMFHIGYLKDGTAWYGGVSTYDKNEIENMNLPSEVQHNSSDQSFDPLDGPDEYVKVDLEKLNNNHVTPSTNEEFIKALEDKKCIIVDHDIESPVWDIIQPDIKIDGATGSVILVYDEKAGMYYTVNYDGTYSRDMYGYTPDELMDWDVEKHAR